jgi:hypothetical protein
MSSVDDYKMALNILARTGIDSPDFVKEFAKAKATLHQMSSTNQVQGQNSAPVMPQDALGGTQMGQPPQSTNEPLGAVNTLNQPNQGKYDNL